MALEQHELVIRLVKNPQELQSSHLAALEQYKKDFPYLQAVRALIAKLSGSSYHIKNAAAFTAHRSVLRKFLKTSFDTNINVTTSVPLQTEMINAFETFSLNESSNTPIEQPEIKKDFLQPEAELSTKEQEILHQENSSITSEVTSLSPELNYQLTDAYHQYSSLYDDTFHKLMKDIEESKKALDKTREESLQKLDSHFIIPPKEQTNVKDNSVLDKNKEQVESLDFSFFDITLLTEPKENHD
ncbi:MAG: hypothetical protein NZM38_03405 [Cytophagales bacterium]|nr:hypothetical protein [Cytophagales bacterium]MDW8383801.1 hypothetical protein [Flammeovirgaceae bacterium]